MQKLKYSCFVTVNQTCLFGRAIINVGSFRDSLVSLLQLLDLPLQFKVVGATRRHPTEGQKGGGGGIIDEVRNEGRQLLRPPNICVPLLIYLMFCFN